MDAYFKELISLIKERGPSKEQLSRLKIELCRKYGRKSIPTDIEVLLNVGVEDLDLVRKFLVTKPVRTQSGVAVVAVMTAPFSCKHGKCTFCPGGPGSVYGDMPMSYTGKEPSTMRGVRNRYDPYLIVMNRLEQYVVLGQSPEKVEVVVMGGTFPSFDVGYQTDFVRGVFQALNDFSELFFDGSEFSVERFKEFFELPGKVADAGRVERIHRKLNVYEGRRKGSLEDEEGRNERSCIRCVALCIETKPDWCMRSEIDRMLVQGTTRVELGVQSVYDSVLKGVNRGHSVEDSIDATRLLKDSLLKVTYHVMPGLPGVSAEEDEAGLLKLFSDPRFRPDALKVYPCMVMPGTPLWEQWKRGEFVPLSTAEAAERIARFKRIIPKWCRVMRVQRDIPTYQTEAGVDRTNLRQYIEKVMKEKGWRCRCIRCREPKQDSVFEDVQVLVEEYDASEGKEVFISVEDVEKDVLLGFCRLRIPSKPFRKEFGLKTAGIREVHVYGRAVGLGGEGEVQHKGLGMRLVQEAERIAREKGMEEMLIISGVGVREYYEKKLGYRRKGVYVWKRL
ncbi:tRNA uridine(34) 5-carboxymethylaminomethyl modification radical SAM/GNAT enzyme Elp3 [Candidatus Woesearchaeota archaeon]|nr:tRNA uridine(34) 5-carboxymethylaminomethyl modification radical SAM/GNAT enzyme Elp3 [Candidatus Woesearchaeota archaeon]